MGLYEHNSRRTAVAMHLQNLLMRCDVLLHFGSLSDTHRRRAQLAVTTLYQASAR